MKVSVGFATIFGTIASIAAVLIPMIGQLADTAAPLGVPGSLWLKVSAVLAVAVVVGRMAQSAIAVAKNPPTNS